MSLMLVPLELLLLPLDAGYTILLQCFGGGGGEREQCSGTGGHLQQSLVVGDAEVRSRLWL